MNPQAARRPKKIFSFTSVIVSLPVLAAIILYWAGKLHGY
jgi:hypothetical protein